MSGAGPSDGGDGGGGGGVGGGAASGTPQQADSLEQVELREAAQALQLTVSPGQLAAMRSYLALLRRWNATFNLTAIRDPRAMVTQHLVDCLAAFAAIDASSRAQAPSTVATAGASPVSAPAAETGLRVLDVGSGGGLPGVVLAIMNPAWSVTCIDAVAKKAAFIRQVAATVPLKNLYAEHRRVEQRRGGPFDLITARAFASLADLVRLTRASLAPGGQWAAMKGQVPRDEIAALPPDVEAFHVERLAVPGMDAERCLVWMRQRRDT